MANKYPIFEIPIVLVDLRQDETLLQIADCLDYLAKITDTVFDCINSRIKQNKTKINELHQRALAAKSKVEKLKGIKKATKIFSTSKYPASNIHKDYISIFSNTNKLVFTPSKVKVIKKKNTSLQNVPSIEEKLQFFHVKDKSKVDININVNQKNGLGELPHNIESVSSLLLFNTSENPYERFVTLDPMGVIGKVRKIAYEETSHQIEAAPISITKSDQLEEQIKENYFYSPSLGNVPNIDAPLDLPDLPGVADDLKYSLDLGPGFAPSVTTTPKIPDLPMLPDDTLVNEITDQLFSTFIDTNSQATLVQLPSSPLPPPPPPPLPPPPPPSDSTPVSTEFPISSPPIPPPLPIIDPLPIQKNDSLSPAHIYSPIDARADLMAAIRNAGGKAKLKPISSGRDESKRIKEERHLAAEGGDLMADLHNKLLMRRKGISGTGKLEANSAVSAMDKVSAMIPAPTHNDMSSATEDDEWEE